MLKPKKNAFQFLSSNFTNPLHDFVFGCLTHPVWQMIHLAGLHGSQLATPSLEASCHEFLVISRLFYPSADQTLAVSYLQRLLRTENAKRKAFKWLNVGTLYSFIYIYIFFLVRYYPINFPCIKTSENQYGKNKGMAGLESRGETKKIPRATCLSWA